MTPLHEAAARGILTTLDPYKSISPRFDIDEKDGKGRTALAYGALKGHVEVVKLLLKEGANVNSINDKNRTALWYASFSHSSVTKQQRREVIEQLLQKGAKTYVQAKDGSTALMKLIEHREPGAIRLLMQNDASVEDEKGSKVSAEALAKAEALIKAEALAKATNDQAVIQAVKQAPGQASSRDELVTEIVNYVLKSIGFWNYALKGAIKTFFGIQGDIKQPLSACVPEGMKSNIPNATDIQPEKSEIFRSRIFTGENATSSLIPEDPEDPVRTLAVSKEGDDEDVVPPVPLVSEISEHTTAEEFQASMMKFINETGLDHFFPEGDDFLKVVADKAVELQGMEDNLLNMDEDIQDITKLALYQPVFYCDDSGSMKQGTRRNDQIDLVRRVARISTLLVPEGYGAGLLFINDKRNMNPKLNAKEVEDIMKATNPSGKTRIGTQLELKILKPLVYDVINRGEKLKRPVLVSCITDGCASGETKTKFRDTIIECIQFLLDHGYPAQAIRFQISQIGNDSAATSFLEELQKDGALEEVLFCTTQRLDEEYRKFNENEEDLERWLLKTLMEPITSLGGGSD